MINANWDDVTEGEKYNDIIGDWRTNEREEVQLQRRKEYGVMASSSPPSPSPSPSAAPLLVSPRIPLLPSFLLPAHPSSCHFLGALRNIKDELAFHMTTV